MTAQPARSKAVTSAQITPSLRPGRGRVLVVDDEQPNRTLLMRLLISSGYDVQIAVDGESALDAVRAQAPDIVLLDVEMPGMSGFEVCRRLKQDAATRLIPVVIVTGLQDRVYRIEGINAGADDFLAKPFDSEELQARVHSLVTLKHYTDDLESAESVILTLAVTVEARDHYTQGHCQRLAGYATALGEAINLSKDELASLYRGGFLHDVGKIGIPDSILLKPGRLTIEEFEVMKQHTVIGERLCGNLRSLQHVRPIVRSHHERRDGQGYPDGLRGDDIPLLAQIVGIADVYDALFTTRPYRPAMTADQAHEELRNDAANGVRRRDLVETFIQLSLTGRLQERAQTAQQSGLRGI